MLKHSLKAAVLLGSIVVATSAFADNHTFSIGYAQTDVEEFKDLRGVNLQYRYEWNSPLSLLGSISYLSRDAKTYESASTYYDTKVEYFSYLLGPAYRFNNYVSAYGLVGFANIKVDSKEYDAASLEYAYKNTSTEFAYGAGLIVNPTQNLSVNVGYEGTHLKKNEGSNQFNGFNVGVGYRF